MAELLPAMLRLPPNAVGDVRSARLDHAGSLDDITTEPTIRAVCRVRSVRFTGGPLAGES
ncbi:hypothetical protein ABZ897_12870 [Nonomuraea sp. NPDC046802]|uniref:hypothetical protein n=1 Tax=Nonomuraea sp. NPDC046802 TaxID=3154919 RepID=UPI00340C5C1A